MIKYWWSFLDNGCSKVSITDYHSAGISCIYESLSISIRICYHACTFVITISCIRILALYEHQLSFEAWRELSKKTKILNLSTACNFRWIDITIPWSCRNGRKWTNTAFKMKQQSVETTQREDYVIMILTLISLDFP